MKRWSVLAGTLAVGGVLAGAALLASRGGWPPAAVTGAVPDAERARPPEGGPKVEDRSPPADLVIPQEPAILTLERDGTVLRLRGRLASREEQAALVAEASAAGARVEDATRVDPAAEPVRPAAVALAASRLAVLPQGRARARGSRVEIEGDAPDAGAFEALLADPPPGLLLSAEGVRPPAASPFVWSVRRDATELRLSGHAPSPGARARALAEARRLFLDLPVRSEMTVARGLPAGIDYEAVIRLALAQAARLRAGEVRIEGSRLRLDGETLDQDALAAAEASWREARIEGATLDLPALRPPVLDPYPVTIRRGDGAVTLDGYLPDQVARDRLRAEAREVFLGDRIVDRTRTAPGAPAGLDRALSLAVAHLAPLARGEAALRGRSLTLTGTSLYAESAGQLAQRLSRSAPTGWTATAAIRAEGEEREEAARRCQALVDSVLADRTLTADTLSAPLAAAARQCPEASLEIAGFADAPAADAEEVSRRRAQSLADGLVRAGVSVARVAAVGRGEAGAGRPFAVVVRP